MFSSKRIILALAVLLATGLSLHYYVLAKDEKPAVTDREAETSPALEGNCPVCLKEMGKVIKGSPDFTSVYDGKTYRFPGEKQLSMFKADPEKYIPALGGDCVVCRVENRKNVAGKAEFFKVFDDRLFLFPGEEQRAMFEKNPARYTHADLALDGNCPVCLVKMNKIVPGDPKLHLTRNGMRYLFPGEEQRKAFREDPEIFTGKAVETKYRDLVEESAKLKVYGISDKADCGCED